MSQTGTFDPAPLSDLIHYCCKHLLTQEACHMNGGLQRHTTNAVRQNIPTVAVDDAVYRWKPLVYLTVYVSFNVAGFDILLYLTGIFDVAEGSGTKSVRFFKREIMRGWGWGIEAEMHHSSTNCMDTQVAFRI